MIMIMMTMMITKMIMTDEFIFIQPYPLTISKMIT